MMVLSENPEPHAKENQTTMSNRLPACQSRAEMYLRLSRYDSIPDKALEPAYREQIVEEREAARYMCGSCPLQQQCLTNAVVLGGDGFIAGTTGAERAQLQKVLGWKPEPGDYERQPCDADDSTGRIFSRRVLDRLITEHPDASNAELGTMAGCSAHTVMRRKRALAAGAELVVEPSREQIMRAAHELAVA